MFARLALLIFILSPLTADADPVSFVAAIGTFLGASAATAFVVGLAVTQIALTIGMAVYGAAQQRRAERAQRDAYNANLQDRTVTKVATEAPHVFVLGRARVGSAIVAIFTSGDKDQFKHLVCVHAAHECDGIEEVYIAGKALGALDSGGNVTRGDYFTGTTESQWQATTGNSITLSRNPIAGSISVVLTSSDRGGDSEITFSQSGNVLSFSNPSGANVIANYQYTDGVSRVRVSKHLGGAGDPADAGLMAAVPDKWNSASVLRGYCYTVITLDLNHPEFQGGIQGVEVLLRGKKLYDVRTNTMAWSQNPALAIYWYLTSELCGVSQGDIPVAQVIAAANVCDEYLGPLTIGERYTVNGTVTSDQTQSGVLEKMAQAMAGGIVATTWDMFAGKYIAPVLALDQSDIIGSIAVTPGASDADLFNGVRGQYVGSDNSYVATDFGPYQNPTYVIADGRELWTNIDFPFTNHKQRVHNLARIFTEDQRNGYTVKAQFSMKTWGIKIGQRVTLTSPFFGWSAKVFRVTDKSYSPGSPVDLTLKEDAASIWDEADATEPDSTLNTDLQNPFAILPLESIYTTSGSTSLLQMGDGTIVSRILLEWPAARTQAVFTSGVIEFEWQQIGTIAWERDTISGSSLQAYISTVQDGSIYVIRARCRNPYFNTVSNWVYGIHKVVGKSQPPPDVSLFTVAVMADGTRRFSFGIADQPVDVLAGGGFRVKYRVSGSGLPWSEFTPLHSGLITQSPFETNNPLPGIYDFGIEAVDTSGIESLAASLRSNVIINNGDYVDAANYTGIFANSTGISLQAMNALVAANKAETAQVSAQLALDDLAEIASDNVLSKSEKPRVILDYSEITNEQPGIHNSSSTYGQSSAEYNNSISALSSYLNGLLPSYSELTVNTPISGVLFRQKFIDVYTARQTLLNAIAARSKVIGDTAQLTADNAATAAGNAQSGANTANAALSRIASDNVLSVGEKTTVVMDFNTITTEQYGIEVQADSFGVPRSAYNNSIGALSTYLNSISPAYNDLSSDSDMNGNTFRQKFIDVYTARQTLLNAIAARSKVIGDTAQLTADNAETAAGNAQSGANIANAALSRIASDNVLSAGEKTTVVMDFNTITTEQYGIEVQADSFGVPRSAYNNSIGALSTYLNSISPAYNDLSSDSDMNGNTFRQKFIDVYTARQTLLNAIAAKAGTIASWNGVSGAGRPQDNANYTTNTNQLTDGSNLGGTSSWAGVSGRPSDDSILNNRIDLSWWVRDAGIPWGLNAEYNRIVMTGTDVGGTGPRGQNDLVWYCAETTGDGQSGGGWNGAGVKLDPSKTYRFVVPIRRIDGSGTSYWGINGVCSLNTTTNAENPYFAVAGLAAGDWHLFIGYIFPAGSVGNTNDGAGVYSCKTGLLIGGGTNYNHTPGATSLTHRAYQYYASLNAQQLFGRPMVNLVDGTEPSLREFFATSAVLNSSQQWGDVAGSGRPSDYATVGAQFGVNISGSITTGNVGTFIDPLAIGTGQIANNAATDVISTSASNFQVTYGNGDEQAFASLTYTAKVSSPALLSLSGGLTNTYHSVGGGGGPYYFYGNGMRIYQSVTGVSSPTIVFNDNSASISSSQIIPISSAYIFDLVKDTTYTFSALVYNRTNRNDTVINSANLRMEAIKK